MRKSLLLGLSLTLAFGAQVSVAATYSAADAAFQRQFGDAFLAKYWQLYPEAAISAGYYKYADRSTVPDERSRAERAQFSKTWLERLHALRPETLNVSNRVDWALLDNHLQSSLWSLMEFRSWQWDPATYNVANPIALLLTTEYAPLERRLRTVAKRLARIPMYYAAAKRSIENPTREHTQLAIQQNQGVLEVLGADLQKQLARAKLNERERTQFEQRLAAARAAIEDYVQWLESLDARLASGSARSFRIGRELYERRFAYAIQSGSSAEALYRRALEEKEQLLTRMDLLSEELWPKYFPNTALPRDRLVKIGRLVAKLSEQHVARESLFAEINRLIPELERWVTSRDLIDLDPSRPLEVRETPKYQRGVAGASISAAGPYNPTARTYFNVTPLDDYTPERAESYLREYNRWALPIMAIHEAIPGHYLQLGYANKSPSRIKTLFGNAATVEGWAVYAERMMLESGYQDDTAEAWLIYSKWNLRSVCNTILDYSVHVLNMSEAQAKQLLTREAFQSDEEAANKWRRAQRTSVQLTSYFAGYVAIYDLRERLKREWGERFDLKRFHQRLLSYGNAPASLLDELVSSP